MQQISELNVDTTINELLNSELGFLLIKKDTKNEDVYEVLNKTGIVSDWTLRFVLTNNYHHIVFHFFPLLYSETDNMEKTINSNIFGWIKKDSQLVKQKNLVIVGLSCLM